MRPTPLFSVALFAVLLAACSPVEREPSAAAPPVAAAREDGVGGDIFGSEVAVDAPWRIEPEVSYPCKGCSPVHRYGAVPLSVVVRDGTDSQMLDVTGITVEEVGTGLAPQAIPLSAFHEVERTGGPWLNGASGGPAHTVCRHWRGEDCSALGTTSNTTEWDGTVLYPLRQAVAPGQRVTLKVFVDYRVWRYVAGQYRLVTDRFDNTLLVVMGYPLPRFDSRWVYGDVHYHSQGTDNEGESGYSHRTTLQAMSALGLDFAFATEHASNSNQFHDLGHLVSGIGVLRDMSPARFEQLLGALNLAGGANEEVVSASRLRAPGVLSVPQLFLGGEVDVIPELGVRDYWDNVLRFGNQKGLYWLAACSQLPYTDVVAGVGVTDFIDPCPTGTRADLTVPAYDTVTRAPVPDRWFLKDVQGPYSNAYFARQHLLHLPRDPSNPAAFIASDTTAYGGASRRLETLLTTEYTQQDKGIAFLAHPVDFTTSSAPGRLGPDIVPYSAAQLEDAFRNRAVLGLELWNEDTHLQSSRSNPWSLSPLESSGGWQHVDAGEQFQAIHEGLATFDRMLLWSVDPAKRGAVSWLSPGQFRKVFLSAGSDAHGDLNYSRKGYLIELDSVNDSALGKPRNLAMVPVRTGRVLSGAGTSTRAVAQADVVTALRSGQFIATDGPIVRIAFDLNGNGVIDDADAPMGGDTAWTEYSPTVRLVVEWRSTPEFGRVTTVDLVVNAFTNATGLGMSYAPYRAGVRGWQHSEVLRQYTAAGETFTELQDHYFLDPTGQLRITVPAAEGYGGRRVVVLDPQRFKTGRTYAGSVPCLACDNPTSFNQRSTTDPLPMTCENTCAVQGILDLRAPDALVIRASGVTAGLDGCTPGLGDCETRLALTNPLWARYQASAIAF